MTVKTTHTLTAWVECPANGSVNMYEVSIHTNKMIMVEQIIKAVDEIALTPHFQEDFTERLAKALGAEVETKGVHSGVQTRCSC